MQRELSVKDIFWLHSVAAAVALLLLLVTTQHVSVRRLPALCSALLIPLLLRAGVPLPVLVRLCCHACVCVSVCA